MVQSYDSSWCQSRLVPWFCSSPVRAGAILPFSGAGFQPIVTGSVDGAAALNQGQRVQEIGYLVGILASKANCLMANSTDALGTLDLRSVDCAFAGAVRTGCDCLANHVSWPTTPQ